MHEPAGKFLVVQGKDVGSDGSLVLEGMARVADVPGKGAPDTLAAGELVFQTRGLSYRAASVPDDAPPMVAAGSLFILRPDPSRVIADYLVFFLNLPATQAVLRQLATGSTIPNLRRSAIEQLALPLPSLADQHKLVALSRLVRQQADYRNASERSADARAAFAGSRTRRQRGRLASNSNTTKAVRTKSSENAISQR